MTVSVALCTYNGEEYIHEQLQSIASQSLLPDEIVVCDDGSTDGTLSIIERFKEKVSFPIRIYKNDNNLGSTKNFEKALTLCRGDILFLCDQDDIWLTKKIETIIDFFKDNNGIDVIFSDGYIFNESGDINTLWEAAGFPSHEREIWKKGRIFDSLLKNNNVATGATMALRKQFLSYALPIPADTVFWIHDGFLILFGAAIGKCFFIEEKLIRYRQHANQQIGFKSGEKFNFIKLLLKRLKKMEWIPIDATLPIVYSDLYKIRELLKMRPAIEKNLSILDQKIKHKEKRIKAIKSRPLVRIYIILVEFLLGNYNTFSANKGRSQWFFIFKDLTGLKKNVSI